MAQTVYTLTKGDRKYKTTDATEKVNLTARGWRVEPEAKPAAKAVTPQNKADAPASK